MNVAAVNDLDNTTKVLRFIYGLKISDLFVLFASIEFGDNDEIVFNAYIYVNMLLY